MKLDDFMRVISIMNIIQKIKREENNIQSEKQNKKSPTMIKKLNDGIEVMSQGHLPVD